MAQVVAYGYPGTVTGTGWTDPNNAVSDNGSCAVQTIFLGSPDPTNVLQTTDIPAFASSGWVAPEVRCKINIGLTNDPCDILFEFQNPASTDWCAGHTSSGVTAASGCASGTTLTSVECKDFIWTGANLAAATQGVRITFLNHTGDGDINVDYISMEVTYELPPLSGFDLSTASLKSVSSSRLPNGGGAASIIVSGVTSGNLSTLLSNIGKTCHIWTVQYATIAFLGQVRSYRFLNYDTIEFIAIDQARKLTRQSCNHNPIQYSGQLRKVADNVCYDSNGIFSTSWASGSPVMSVEKADSRGMLIYPNSLDEISGLSPVAGDVTNLYHYDTDLQYNQTVETWSTGFVFKVFCKDVTQIANITMYVNGGFPMYAGGYEVDDPEWRVYNYTSASYETLETLTDTSGTTGTIQWYDRTFQKNANIDTMTDYFSLVAGANAAGYKEYEFKMSWYVGHAIDSGALTADWYFKIVQLDIGFTQDQLPGIGQGVVDATTTTTVLTIDDVNPSFAMADFPASDGIAANDFFYITKYINGIVDDVFSSASTTFTVSRNLTNGDEDVISLRDLTDESIHDFLMDVCKTLNGYYWQTYRYVINVKSIDNFSTLGITLDNDDFFYFPIYTEDGKELYDTIKVSGLYQTSNDAVSPEYSLEDGNEELLKVDENLRIQKAVDQWSTSLVAEHSKTEKHMIITLNYSNPNQDYSGIDIMTNIPIQFKDEAGNVLRNFTAGNLGVMTVMRFDYEYNPEDNIELVTLHCRRLYS